MRIVTDRETPGASAVAASHDEVRELLRALARPGGPVLRRVSLRVVQGSQPYRRTMRIVTMMLARALNTDQSAEPEVLRALRPVLEQVLVDPRGFALGVVALGRYRLAPGDVEGLVLARPRDGMQRTDELLQVPRALTPVDRDTGWARRSTAGLATAAGPCGGGPRPDVRSGAMPRRGRDPDKSWSWAGSPPAT